jgi:hypothetical protein
VISNSENQFSQFRSQLYHEHFNNRKDTLMDLLDSLCSDTQARSVVELSLNPHFKRDYNSLYKAITEYQPQQAFYNLAELAAPYLPPLWKGQFRVLGLDFTACPRPYAFKLSQRESVYKPTPIKGQKPITYGHLYLNINQLSERLSRQAPAWAIPLSTQRVNRADQEQQAITRMRSLLEDPKLPFSQELCIQLGDSNFSTPTYLAAFGDKSNLVTIVRSRGNRKYYFPSQVKIRSGRGHAAWYGHRMKLNDPKSVPPAEEEVTLSQITRQGQPQTVVIQAWKNVVMRGKYKPVRLLMQNYPFTLVKVEVYNTRQERVFKKPLWLIVMGKQRGRLSLPEMYAIFSARSDMEHFFRFGKQKLLLDGFQTCETEHEEHWWQLVNLAYLQLWVAKKYASCLPRPWEQHLPQIQARHLSPTMVKRTFDRIIRQFGTLSRSHQPRNHSP